MYGIPFRSNEYDYYRKHAMEKRIDFGVGALATGIIWYLFFQPVWYMIPMIFFFIALTGILFGFERRYLLYGIIATVFFPLTIFGGLMWVYFGRKG